jgi:hypothetical protein
MFPSQDEFLRFSHPLPRVRLENDPADFRTRLRHTHPRTSSLGLTGPPLVGTVIAALTLLPLIALAVHGPSGKGRIVARSSASTRRRRDEPARAPSQY